MKTPNLSKVLYAIGLILIAAASLSAQNALLEYAEGTVERMNTSGKWQKIDIGSSSPPSLVRLRDGALAEFRIDGTSIHLSKDGSYNLSTLLVQAKKQRPTATSSIATSKIAKIMGTSTEHPNRSAVAGVRATEGSSESKLEWSTEDEDNPSAIEQSALSPIRELIAIQKYDQALSEVNKVLKAGTSDTASTRLLKARIFSLQGRSAAALRELEKASIKKGQPSYPEVVLLTASQSLEVQEWDAAISRALEGQGMTSDPELVQTYKLIQAVGLRGKGNHAQATELLRQIVAAGTDTDTSTEAGLLMKQ